MFNNVSDQVVDSKDDKSIGWTKVLRLIDDLF